MSVTDAERREVAARLRELAVSDYDGEFFDCGEVENALGLVTDDGSWYEAAGVRRLADLIEPDSALTCELEPTASERTNAPVRVYECDCCGRSCDSVYAEDYVYCPFCGRLNTNREVEVEE